jgi:DNA-binding winged helix-turn-helix (wHTH) protein
MSELGPTHPLTYRAEIAAPLFDLLHAGESAAIIAPASMGKSRLLQFLLRPDVQQHYLGDTAATTWLVLADCNRLAELSEWGLYELLLTALTEAAAGQLGVELRDWLNGLRREAIIERNALLARRHVELATRALCREHGLRLCFILDEFDAAYKALPPAALANLRALRDADKYSVCFILLMRDHPERLRNPADSEGFYELISRSILGLKPYRRADAQQVIAQLAARRRHAVSAGQEAELLLLSGGHPGLLVALFDVLMRGIARSAGINLTHWALEQPQMVEECRKLWVGLGEDERQALSHLVQGISPGYGIRQLLELKGLVLPSVDGGDGVFSPVFREYILSQGVITARALWLDEGAAVVWIEGRRVADLTRLEYDLLRLLYHRLGQVCSRDDILAALYPDEVLDPEAGSADNRVDSLIRHLRKAIEPDNSHPRYLLTIRGHGYKLVDTPE